MGIKAPDKEFACMAEARAFYYRMGFTDSKEGNSETTKIMSKPDDPLAGSILLWKKGFLHVVAMEM